MIYIPDLFSAYTEGQEKAIDRNWNDLNQYETVEQARTNNDLARINLQAGMDDYGNNRAISDAVGTQAMIGEDLLKRGYRGDAANAEMNSILAGAQYNSVLNNLPQIDTAANATLVNNLGQQVYNADAGAAFRGVDTNLLPQRTAAYQNANVAAYQVANQNSAAAPIDNASLITSNRNTRALNDATTATGLRQDGYTNSLLQPSYEAQVATLNQGQQQIVQTEAQRVANEKQRVASTIDNLNYRISSNNAAITTMRATVAQNPAVASAYSRQIIQLEANIKRDQIALANIEKQFGSYAQNTVQSLMGN